MSDNLVTRVCYQSFTDENLPLKKRKILTGSCEKEDSLSRKRLLEITSKENVMLGVKNDWKKQLIQRTRNNLPKKICRTYEITHLFGLTQIEAANALNMSKPTFAKRWRKAVGNERKWPFRYVLRLNRQIRQLTKKRFPTEKDQLDLAILISKKDQALKPVFIEIK